MFKLYDSKSQGGFTLIEILVVIVILGILTAIAIPQMSAYRCRANNALALDSLRHAQILQEAYHANKDTYALNKADLKGLHPVVGVQLFIVNASDTGYTMRAFHDLGDLIYTVMGPGGSISHN